MTVHWVSYDVGPTTGDDTSVRAFLASLDDWASALISGMFVRSDFTAAELRDAMSDFLGAGDYVVVVAVDGEDWATFGLPDAVNEWLHDNA